MFEGNAKEKWCPFARATDNGDDDQNAVSVNRGRDGIPDQWCLCMASDCMAWRWDDADDGHCGLAGNAP